MTIEEEAKNLEDLVNVAAHRAADGLNSCIWKCATNSSVRDMYGLKVTDDGNELFVDLKIPAHLFAGRVADCGRELEYQDIAYGITDRNFVSDYNQEYGNRTPDIDGICPSELINVEVKYAGPNFPAYFMFTFKGEHA